jgi:hypothetical protein
MIAVEMYISRIVPLLARIVTWQTDTPCMKKDHGDAIVGCVPPARVLSVVEDAVFINVRRVLRLGIFSEYPTEKACICSPSPHDA